MTPRTPGRVAQCADTIESANHPRPFRSMLVLVYVLGGGTLSTAFAAEMQAARSRTDELFALLSPGALYERPVPERHRLIFYLGHLEAFDWNLICRTTLGVPSFHPTFDKLFAFGIDPQPGREPADIPEDWPSIGEVQRYGMTTRNTIDGLLANVPLDIVQTAIEHRLMHAETFSYLIHNLPYSQKAASGASVPQIARSPVRPEMIDIRAGRVTLGQRQDAFGWDNEFDEHTVEVAAFRIGKYKVTNREYLDFVREGAPAPHFWTRSGDDWLYRGMFGVVPLPMEAPVYVSHQDAAAYAKWAGKSLPGEAQFHRAAFGTPTGEERRFPWGDKYVPFGNFDFQAWDPIAVNATPLSESAFGVAQLTGNGWEWTSTAFGPFPGFESFPFYPGYSRDFFDGEHYVMKGASPRTAARFLRRSFRNWFRPTYPYAYATFRLVES